MISQNKRLIGILLTIVILLSIPLIAMQFTAEVDWKLFDFVIMGILLLGTGLACELVMRKIKKPVHRIVICGIVLVLFFLIWAELAVGIFGHRLRDHKPHYAGYSHYRVHPRCKRSWRYD